METSEESPLSASEIKTLGDKAIAAKAKAYCRYSNFRVGACILTSSNEYITGANVENAALSPGICAERTAMTWAVSQGHLTFRALAVAADTKGPGPITPCGMCRQFMREFCGEDFPVYMYDKEGEYTLRTMGELLPMSFGPKMLGGETERARGGFEGWKAGEDDR